MPDSYFTSNCPFFLLCSSLSCRLSCMLLISDMLLVTRDFISIDTFEWRGVRFVFSKVFQSCVSAKVCSWVLAAIWAFLIVITLCRIVFEYKQTYNHVNDNSITNGCNNSNHRTYLNASSATKRAESTITSSSGNRYR